MVVAVESFLVGIQFNKLKKNCHNNYFLGLGSSSGSSGHRVREAIRSLGRKPSTGTGQYDLE